jgi:hypothetical protein
VPPFSPGQVANFHSNENIGVNSIKKVIFLCFSEGQTFEQSINEKGIIVGSLSM